MSKEADALAEKLVEDWFSQHRSTSSEVDMRDLLKMIATALDQSWDMGWKDKENQLLVGKVRESK